MFFKTIPLILASLMISAHFFRHYNYILMTISLLVPFMLTIKRRWSLIIVQIFAFIGGGVWINTIINIAQRRMMSGEEWGRMALILGAVALFTIFSGLLLNSPKVKDKYP